MKITGPGPIRSTEVRRRTRSAAAGGEKFTVERQGGKAGGPPVAAVNAVAGVDALLAIQEVHDGDERRRAAVQHGQTLLDRLDDILHALLIGTIPKHRLQALAEAARASKPKIEDQRLAEILREIEVRAAVELAKYDLAH